MSSSRDTCPAETVKSAIAKEATPFTDVVAVVPDISSLEPFPLVVIPGPPTALKP